MADRLKDSSGRIARVLRGGICGALSAFASAATVTAAIAADFSGEFSLEGRVFFEDDALSAQHGPTASAYLQPELFAEWAEGSQSLTVVPFFRVDGGDGERTHWDVREFLWLWVGDGWEFQAGLGKVFWGVAESNHLVDIINQTDFVEDIDSEDKLGQPMLNLRFIKDWGTLNFYALPYFRERTFAGKHGRPSLLPYVEEDLAEYDSSAEEWHTDWAIRYNNTFGIFDLGIYHFWGTSREPRYQPVIRTPDDVVIRPFYDIIHQTGVDVQATSGSWLWKLEALRRSGMADTFIAFVGGFEYTFFGVGGSAVDLGLVGEYHYDEREDQLPAIHPQDIPALIAAGAVFPAELPTFSLTPFDSDVMVGMRLAFNDVATTEALLGMAVDHEDGTTYVSLEGSRRLSDQFSLELKARFFTGVDDRDPLFFFEKDDYLQINFTYYF